MLPSASSAGSGVRTKIVGPATPASTSNTPTGDDPIRFSAGMAAFWR